MVFSSVQEESNAETSLTSIAAVDRSLKRGLKNAVTNKLVMFLLSFRKTNVGRLHSTGEAHSLGTVTRLHLLTLLIEPKKLHWFLSVPDRGRAFKHVEPYIPSSNDLIFRI